MIKERDGDEWLRTSEVAGLLGYSTAWVRQQIVSGVLRAQTHWSGSRRSFRIKRSDLDQFIDDQFDQTKPGLRPPLR